ncbi:MAG TPA: carbohydrate kinase family protein [Chitinophaga sp.]
MQTTPFDVLVAGELNVDLILNGLNTLPVIGKEILAKDMTFTLGSSSAIFACNLRTLGPSVSFIGKVGNDSFGLRVCDALQQKNVDTSRILRSNTAATGISIALNYAQDRAMITYPGAMEELSADDISDKALMNARHLHVSAVFLQPGLRPGLNKLFERAKALGLTTSLDPQWDPAEQWEIDLERLLPNVDVFLPNIAELQALTKLPSLQSSLEAIRPFARLVAIKHGEQGAYIWNGQTLFHQPPYLHTDIADCIGAGDSFNAGFISQFILNRPLQQCAAYAALAGAINTTAPGGTTAFQNLAAFHSIARQKFNYTPA